ncbi:hypothetical protein F7725_001142, partial [Dissostichus mawsoni]
MPVWRFRTVSFSVLSCKVTGMCSAPHLRTPRADTASGQPSSIPDVEAQVSHLQVAGVFVLVEQNQEADVPVQLDPTTPVVVHGDRHPLPRHRSLLIDGEMVPPLTFHHYSVQREGDHDVPGEPGGGGNGMGAKVADTKVAMLSSVSLWSSTLGAGTGVGEVSREDASGGGVVMSGTGGAEVELFSASREGTVTLTGGRVVLTVLGCGVRGFPGRRAGSVRTELGGGVVLMVNTVVV